MHKTPESIHAHYSLNIFTHAFMTFYRQNLSIKIDASSSADMLLFVAGSSKGSSRAPPRLVATSAAQHDEPAKK